MVLVVPFGGETHKVGPKTPARSKCSLHMHTGLHQSHLLPPKPSPWPRAGPWAAREAACKADAHQF